MRLRVKDLSTKCFPHPFGLMLAWSAKGLDQIDFDEVQTVHFSTRSECEVFKCVVEEKKLSCVIRYDYGPLEEVTQYSWTFSKGMLTKQEIANSKGAVYWLKYTHNEFGAITSLEHSCGAKINITYDSQSNVVSVSGNEEARKQVFQTYFMEWCPESRLLDCRLTHKQDIKGTDWDDECLFSMIGHLHP